MSDVQLCYATHRNESSYSYRRVMPDMVQERHIASLICSLVYVVERKYIASRRHFLLSGKDAHRMFYQCGFFPQISQ